MATTASAIEQIYKVIKADICAGVILPGARVNISAYCVRLGVSKSPIRNALYQLVGEGLLEPHPHDGFYRPRVIEQSLYDVYLWNEHALFFAFDLVASMPPSEESLPPLPDARSDIVTGIEQLFTAVAALSANAACTRQIQALNEELRPIRLQEPEQFTDLGPELEALTTAWLKGDLSRLRQDITIYHARRRQSVRQLVALAYREQAIKPPFQKTGRQT